MFDPLPRRLGLLFCGSPALLAAAALLVLLGAARLLLHSGGPWVLLVGLSLIPVGTAIHGVSLGLALREVRRADPADAADRAFWSAALLASAGLLVGVWWWSRSRVRVRPTRTTPPEPSAPAFGPLPPAHVPTVRHGGPVPLARRPQAELSVVPHPLRPHRRGPLAPTVLLRRSPGPRPGRPRSSVDRAEDTWPAPRSFPGA